MPRLQEVKNLLTEIFPDCAELIDTARDMGELTTIVRTRRVAFGAWRAAIAKPANEVSRQPSVKSYLLRLTAVHPHRKLQTIKVIREISGIGPRAAQVLVESELPVVVIKALTMEEAKMGRKLLAAVQATAELMVEGPE